MKLRPDVNEIIKELRDAGVIELNTIAANQMNGTTEGLVYTLTVNNQPQYVLKWDSPLQISLVEQLHRTYSESALMPKLLYTEPNKTYIVYSYISGTTHYNRGSKIDWLTYLVQELLNRYIIYPETDKWGFWLEKPCQTWCEFIDQGVEYARMHIGSLLPIEDYYKVKSFVENLSKREGHERYLLHGDCGVHNLVFDQQALCGIIDPSPIVGPVLYDYIYAFCSSPDDLNLETLFQAFSLLVHQPIEKSSLIEEVIIQLYCRIGICLKHHPHDLSDYLEAWDYWKALDV